MIRINNETMLTATDLIKELQRMVELYGDLPVVDDEDYGRGKISSLVNFADGSKVSCYTTGGTRVKNQDFFRIF